MFCWYEKYVTKAWLYSRKQLMLRTRCLRELSQASWHIFHINKTQFNICLVLCLVINQTMIQTFFQSGRAPYLILNSSKNVLLVDWRLISTWLLQRTEGGMVLLMDLFCSSVPVSSFSVESPSLDHYNDGSSFISENINDLMPIPTFRICNSLNIYKWKKVKPHLFFFFWHCVYVG